MAPKSKRSSTKLPDQAVPGSSGSNESGPPARATGGLPAGRGQDEQVTDQEPPRISVVGSAQGDNVARNLLPELMEEGKTPGREAVSLMEDAVTELSSAIEEVAATTATGLPPTPITKAVNSVPPKMDPTLPTVPVARMLEALCAKHEALKRLVVTKGGPEGSVRDPGFAAMRDPQRVFSAIVGVFNTAGYSVGIKNQAVILAIDLTKLITAGQAVYDLLFRHQMQRKMEQAVAAGRGGLVEEADLKGLAEQYMGRSKEDVYQLEVDLHTKDGMLKSLEKYLQELADEKAEASSRAAEAEARLAELTAGRPLRTAAPEASAGRTDFKPKVEASYAPATTRAEKEYIAPKVTFSTSDYLADIYEQAPQGVNATARLHQAAVSELKAFDGRSRDEFRGKSWLSSVRSALRRDQLTPGEACLQFPDLLTDRAKMWYRQVDRELRANLPALQKEFEEEYCGGSISPQHRYFDARRKANEEPIDYLYRLNVLAKEAELDYAKASNGRAHVEHFLDTCEDPALARQLSAHQVMREKDLRAMLKSMYRVDARLKRDETLSTRKSREPRESRESRDRDRPAWPPTSPKLDSKARPIAVEALKMRGSSVHWADDETASDSVYKDDESDEEDEPRDEDDRLDAKESTGSRSTAQADPLESLVKAIAAIQGRDISGRQQKQQAPGTQQASDPCSYCGSHRHRDRNCWSRLTCQACGAKGHPTEHCYQRCKACGKVHERGDCESTKLGDQLKAWYDPATHAGLLPTSVEKRLN